MLRVCLSMLPLLMLLSACASEQPTAAADIQKPLNDTASAGIQKTSIDAPADGPQKPLNDTVAAGSEKSASDTPAKDDIFGCVRQPTLAAVWSCAKK